MSKEKVKIKITKHFTDARSGQLYGPGEWEVSEAVADRLVAAGRAFSLKPKYEPRRAAEAKKEAEAEAKKAEAEKASETKPQK